AALTEDDKHIEWLWDALAEALERGAPAEVLHPWAQAIAGDRIWIDDDLVKHARRRSDAQRLVPSIAEPAQPGAPTHRHATNLASWIAAGLADSMLHDVVWQLRDLAGSFEVDVACGIIALSDGTAPDIVAVARLMFEVTEDLFQNPKRRLAMFTLDATQAG